MIFRSRWMPGRTLCGVRVANKKKGEEEVKRRTVFTINVLCFICFIMINCFYISV